MTSRSFPPEPTSAPAARRFVDGAVARLNADTRSRIALIVSEMATNAVLHAATSFRVTVDITARAVTIRVADRGGGSPEAKQAPPPSSMNGRGLLIVSQLSSDWGVERSARGPGKAVWARIDLDSSVSRAG